MIDPISGANVAKISMEGPVPTGSSPTASFSDFISTGIAEANTNLLEAEQLTRAYALGEDVPVHQVTYALEQARLSLELMLQVRNRLVESYQEIMRMQA